MRLNLHARIEIAAVALLLLGSCDSNPALTEKQRDEVSDIAGDAAFEAVNSKVSALEDRVDALEEKLDM